MNISRRKMWIIGIAVVVIIGIIVAMRRGSSGSSSTAANSSSVNGTAQGTVYVPQAQKVYNFNSNNTVTNTTKQAGQGTTQSPAPSGTYYVYPDANSNFIMGTASNVTDAKNLADQAGSGAVVKNSNFTQVYQSSNNQHGSNTYLDYANPGSNNIVGEYHSLTKALNAAQQMPGGTVKNGAYQYLYVNHGTNG